MSAAHGGADRQQAVLTAIALTFMNGDGMLAGDHAGKPAAKEFGPGPRTSAQGLYVATLQGAQTLEPRKMYRLQAIVIDGETGIDGGMPQHGHSLPTRPRVKNLGSGWYEIRRTLADRDAPAAPAGHTELKPLKMNATEVRQLTASGR